MGVCPSPVLSSLLCPANLCVLCPQASPTGEGASGTGIVCGAAAPSSALSQLSFLFSLSRFSPWQLLVLFSFAASSSAGSCFRLTQAVCFAEQGAPQLVSALPGFAPPLRLPALKKIPSVCSPAWLAFTGWDNGPSWELPRKSLAQSCRDKMGRHPQFLFPNS